jgi:hypothetical protein
MLKELLKLPEVSSFLINQKSTPSPELEEPENYTLMLLESSDY